jgi:hypothetical protein
MARIYETSSTVFWLRTSQSATANAIQEITTKAERAALGDIIKFKVSGSGKKSKTVTVTILIGGS